MKNIFLFKYLLLLLLFFSNSLYSKILDISIIIEENYNTSLFINYDFLIESKFENALEQSGKFTLTTKDKSDYGIELTLKDFNKDIVYESMGGESQLKYILQLFVNIDIYDRKTKELVSSKVINVFYKTIQPATEKDKKDNYIVSKEMLRNLVNKLVDKSLLSVLDIIYPIKVSSIISDKFVLLNRGFNGNMETGDIIEIVQIGSIIKDPDTNDILGFNKTIKAYLKIKDVNYKTSKGVIISQNSGIEIGDICIVSKKGAKENSKKVYW